MSYVCKKFESDFARLCGAPHAFSFWKGRIALYAILKAMRIEPGDEIILPGYTCVVDVNPIRYLGAKPVYVDIEPETFNLDVNLLPEKITSRTKVIIAQHTYGYSCDLDRIIEIANRKGIAVIEDACLALGSKYKGRLVGTFGKAAYFSFQWNKLYNTGIGGMALTNDLALAQQIESLCQEEIHKPTFKELTILTAQLVVHRAFVFPTTTAVAQSIFRVLTRAGLVVGSSKYGEYAAAPAEATFFKAMGWVQALSGLVQLGKISKNIAHRKEIVALYDELLEKKGWPPRRYDSAKMDPVMVRYPLRIDDKKRALLEAPRAGVEIGDWFNSVLHQVEIPLSDYGYELGMCPQGEKAARTIVNLPVHPRVNEKTARKTVEFISRFRKVE